MNNLIELHPDPLLFILSYLSALDLKQLSLTHSSLRSSVNHFLDRYHIRELDRSADTLLLITHRTAYEGILNQMSTTLPPSQKIAELPAYLKKIYSFPKLFQFINACKIHFHKHKSLAYSKMIHSKPWRALERLRVDPTSTEQFCQVLEKLPNREGVEDALYPQHLLQAIANKIFSAPIDDSSVMTFTAICYQKFDSRVFIEAIKIHFNLTFPQDLGSPFLTPLRTYKCLFQKDLARIDGSTFARESAVYEVMKRMLEDCHTFNLLKIQAQDILEDEGFSEHSLIKGVPPLLARAINHYLCTNQNHCTAIQKLIIVGNEQATPAHIMPILEHLESNFSLHIELKNFKHGFTEQDVDKLLQFSKSHAKVNLTASFSPSVKQKSFKLKSLRRT